MRSFAISLLLSLAVSASALTIGSPRFTISSSTSEVLRSESFAPGKPPSLLELGPTDILRLNFEVLDKEGGKGVHPHQAFLRFYDEVTGEEGIQPVKVSSNGKAKFDLNMARPPSSLPPTSATPIRVSLILGSFKPSLSPATIRLFDLRLPPSQPAPTHSDEASFHVLPEIVHTFRPEQKLPNPVVSALGTVVVLGPWVLLVVMWSSLPLPLPSLTSPQIIPFVLLLGAFEGLLIWYWVALRLGQVLTYGAILGLVTAVAGNKALGAIGRERVGK